jgi:hypothetical protein
MVPLPHGTEERALGLRLEGLAARHSDALARALDARRAKYERRLRSLQRFIREEVAALRSLTRQHTAASSLTEAWRAGLTHSLVGERGRNIRALDAARARLNMLDAKVVEARALGEGLQESEAAARGEKEKATRRLEEMVSHNAQWVAALQSKVQGLMERLGP